MVEKDKSKHPPSQLQEDLKSPVVDLDFSCAKGLATLLLSPTLDSLVRVSRRAGEPRKRTGTTRKEARINIKSQSSINQGCHPKPSPPDRNNKDAPSGQTQTSITSNHSSDLPFLLNNFRYFLLSFQSAFHLSFTVLVRYRSNDNI